MEVICLIGIGEDARGDDGAGLAVARALSAHAPAGWTVELAGGEATDLLARWQGERHVVVVDAARVHHPPGSWLRLDATKAALPAYAVASTHGQGLAAAVRLGQVLDALPAELVLLAICGERFGLGEPMSEAVARSVERLVRRLQQGELPADGLTQTALQGEAHAAIDA